LSCDILLNENLHFNLQRYLKFPTYRPFWAKKLVPWAKMPLLMINHDDKKPPQPRCDGFFVTLSRAGRMSELLADTELLLGDEGAVAADVLTHQVIEQFATLTYQHLQCTLSRMILLVDLQVLGQVGNTV
jgi:hypothetical protein